MPLPFAGLWDALVGRSKTPLNEVADPETVEELLASQHRVERRLAHLETELRSEWADMLDKLTRLANRAAARQRKRTQREMDELEEEEEREERAIPRPPTATHTAPEVNGNGHLPFDPRNKADLRRYLATKRG